VLYTLEAGGGMLILRSKRENRSIFLSQQSLIKKNTPVFMIPARKSSSSPQVL